MNLRKKFKESRDARKLKKDMERREGIELRLKALTEILPAEMKGMHPDNLYSSIHDKDALFFRVPDIQRYDAKIFSGYKKLHEICAVADISIEVATQIDGGQYSEYVRHGIAVNLKKPYSVSPDAPKKPQFKQLKLF